MPKIAIVGTGLMGTSLALALRQSQLLNLEVVGTDSSGGVRTTAQRTKAFDKVENRLLNAVENADIVVLATPIMAMWNCSKCWQFTCRKAALLPTWAVPKK